MPKYKIIEELVEKIEVIINRHAPMDNFVIKENCARDIYEEVIKKALARQKEDFRRAVEQMKPPRIGERELENLPNKRGIWYAGFSEAKKRLKELK